MTVLARLLSAFFFFSDFGFMCEGGRWGCVLCRVGESCGGGGDGGDGGEDGSRRRGRKGGEGGKRMKKRIKKRKRNGNQTTQMNKPTPSRQPSFQPLSNPSPTLVQPS